MAEKTNITRAFDKFWFVLTHESQHIHSMEKAGLATNMLSLGVTHEIRRSAQCNFYTNEMTNVSIGIIEVKKDVLNKEFNTDRYENEVILTFDIFGNYKLHQFLLRYEMFKQLNTEFQYDDKVLYNMFLHDEDRIAEGKNEIVNFIRSSKLVPALYTNKKDKIMEKVYLNSNIVIKYNSIKPFLNKLVKRYLNNPEIQRITFTGYGLGASLAQLAYINHTLKFVSHKNKFFYYGYRVPSIGNNNFNEFFKNVIKRGNKKSLSVNIENDTIANLLPSWFGYKGPIIDITLKDLLPKNDPVHKRECDVARFNVFIYERLLGSALREENGDVKETAA